MTSPLSAAELTELADTLRSVADRLDGREITPPPSPSPAPATAATGRPVPSPAAYARQILAARAKLATFMDADLFADPARDILLDLFAAGEEGTRISISSCCIAAAVPPTTALRWIGMLKRRGIVQETVDPADARRKWLSLSSDAQATMRAYINAVSGMLSSPA